MATILIVEDEAKMRRLLELNLANDGFKTLSVGDVESGLKLMLFTADRVRTPHRDLDKHSVSVASEY